MAKRKYENVEIGNRYGKLTVVLRLDNGGRQSRFRSLCDCGNTTDSYGFSLKDGSAKSCGCVAAEKSKERWKNPSPELREKIVTSRKRTHSMSKHPIYRSWSDMKLRCENPKHEWFHSYGARGIRVCERWLSSEKFIEDMLPTWSPGLQLGRIDNDKGYCPENCRWETPLQNQNNRRDTVWVDTPIGKMTISEASRLFGITRSCLAYRLRAGYSGESLFKPSERA